MTDDPDDLIEKARGTVKKSWLTKVQSNGFKIFRLDEPVIEHLDPDEQPHYLFNLSGSMRIGELPGGREALDYDGTAWVVVTDERILVLVAVNRDRTVKRDHDYGELSEISLEQVESNSPLSSGTSYLRLHLEDGPPLNLPSPAIGERALTFDGARTELTPEGDEWTSLKRYVLTKARIADALSEAERTLATVDPDRTDDDGEALVSELLDVHESLLEVRSLARDVGEDPPDAVSDLEKQVATKLQTCFESRLSAVEEAMTAGEHDRVKRRSESIATQLETAKQRLDPSLLEGFESLYATASRYRLIGSALSQATADAGVDSMALIEGDTEYGIDGCAVVRESLREVARVSASATREALKRLLSHLGDHPRCCASIVGEIADAHPDAVPAENTEAVIGLLGAESPAIRRDACRILAAIGTETELDALRELTDDPEHEVRTASLRAMRTIAEREGVPLERTDREQMQSMDIQLESDGDLVLGDKKRTDVTTTVEDSVVNRSQIGGESGVEVMFCPDCGADLQSFPDPEFCPSCGIDL
jgi:hypothetical protein